VPFTVRQDTLSRLDEELSQWLQNGCEVELTHAQISLVKAKLRVHFADYLASVLRNNCDGGYISPSMRNILTMLAREVTAQPPRRLISARLRSPPPRGRPRRRRSADRVSHASDEMADAETQPRSPVRQRRNPPRDRKPPGPWFRGRPAGGAPATS
jgi:hypothetical protein